MFFVSKSSHSFQLLSHVRRFVTPWTAACSTSLSPGVCSNSSPSSQCCHPTISFSIALFSCLQYFPASGSFPMSLLFTSGGHSVGASASALASVLPMNILFLYLLKSYSRGQIWRWFVMLCLLEIFGCI